MKLERQEVLDLNRSILVMTEVINKLEEEKESLNSSIKKDINLLSGLYYNSEFELQDIGDSLEKSLKFYITGIARREELSFIIDEIEYKRRLTTEYLEMFQVTEV